jgi:hypothetical protein
MVVAWRPHTYRDTHPDRRASVVESDRSNIGASLVVGPLRLEGKFFSVGISGRFGVE